MDSSRQRICTNGPTESIPTNGELPLLSVVSRHNTYSRSQDRTLYGGCVNVSDRCKARACYAGSVNVQRQQRLQHDVHPNLVAMHGGCSLSSIRRVPKHPEEKERKGKEKVNPAAVGSCTHPLRTAGMAWIASAMLGLPGAAGAGVVVGGVDVVVAGAAVVGGGTVEGKGTGVPAFWLGQAVLRTK